MAVKGRRTYNFLYHRAPRPHTTNEIVENRDYTRRTVQGHLNSLEEKGYVFSRRVGHQRIKIWWATGEKGAL